MSEDMTETGMDILNQLGRHSRMQLEWNQSNDSFWIGKSLCYGTAKRDRDVGFRDAIPIIQHGYVKRISKCGNSRFYVISPAGLRALKNDRKADRKWKPKNTEPIGNPDGGMEHICDLAGGWTLRLDHTTRPPSYYVDQRREGFEQSHYVADDVAKKLIDQYGVYQERLSQMPPTPRNGFGGSEKG